MSRTLKTMKFNTHEEGKSGVRVLELSKTRFDSKSLCVHQLVFTRIQMHIKSV